MSTYTAAYANASINNDVRFRLFGDFISTSLQSAGWTQTGDTGQIDWTTVTAPGGASTFMGYEILYSDSTAGPALYMKIEYGSGFNSASKGFRVNFGTGSDGSGNLTGGSETAGSPGLIFTTLSSPSHAVFSAVGSAAAAGDDYISGDSSRFTVACCDDSNITFNTVFGVSRMHDGAGADTDYGWIFWNYSYNAVAYHFIMPMGDDGKFRAYARDATAPARMFIFRHVGDATHIPVFPIFWIGADGNREGIYTPLRDAVILPTALGADRSDHTFTHVGASRTFKVVYGNVTSNVIWGATAPAAQSLAMRYD